MARCQGLRDVPVAGCHLNFSFGLDIQPNLGLGGRAEEVRRGWGDERKGWEDERRRLGTERTEAEGRLLNLLQEERTERRKLMERLLGGGK